MKTFVCHNKIKLSKFLLDSYQGEMSFSMLNKLFRKKDIKVDGKRVSCDLYLFGGEKIEVYFDGAIVENSFSKIYEDDNVLVIYKNKGKTAEFIFSQLQKSYSEIYFCHRLDTNTDGIMIFAKNKISYDEILLGFKKRTFKKFYSCEVYGIFSKKEGVLSAYLKKDETLGKVEVFSDFVKGSKPITTAYRVLSEDTKRNVSTLEVELLTGRTHQIRAHLAFLGHFILGDSKYGDDRINKMLEVTELKLRSNVLILSFEKGDYLYYLNGKSFEK